MNKFLEWFKSLGGKWKGLSKAKRIGIASTAVMIIMAAILAGVYFTRVQYDVLFSDLDPQDSSKIIDTLKSEKIPYKVQDTSILVPKDQVAELRMSVLSDGAMPSSQKGFELFDQSKFGVTDTEAKVMYQRALEGELARTIEGFDEVDKARVHLVLPEDTVFAKDTQKASASVTLKLKGTSKLTPEQVKAIVALVSGSVKNLPKENVDVVDSDMNLLTENLFNDVTADGSTVSAQKQQEYERQFESGLQGDLKDMLENVFGQGKVSVKVNADMDFDSKQTTTIQYDPKDVVVRSMRKTNQDAQDGTGNSGQTGTNSNFSSFGTATTPTGSTQNSSSTSNDETVNNEIGQTEQKTITAPGEVKRMTVSVLINGSLDNAEKTEIQNIVASATGYNVSRGDQINISAMPFNDDAQKKAEADLAEMQSQEQQAQKMKMYVLIGAGAATLLTILTLVILRLRKKKKEEEEEIMLEQDNIQPQLNVLVGDETMKQPIAYQPVLEDEEDVMSIEKEIQEYATKKPEQVAEVIRTWLSEDER